MARDDETLVLSSCVVHWATREIRERGSAVGRLTATEARLLRFFVEHPGRHVPSAELLREVWDYREGVRSRTVVVTMHRLRGKVEADPKHPVHLQSVTGGGYRFVPVGQATTPSDRTNLPAVRGALVGRERSLAAVEDALESGRVVTITGPAGVGKTRLALEVGRERLGELTGGVWWADVRACASAEDVVDALRGALGLPQAADGPLSERMDALGRALVERGPCMMVVDNAESRVEAVSEVLAELPGRAAEATWLVTSRAPLRVAIERRVLVEPLSDEHAVRLLQLRAPEARDEPAELRDLVTRLDGLPLALELAAPRLPALGCAGLVALLDRRLELLRGHGGRLGLAEALDLSWEVLEQPARRALSALSGFPGDFSLDDALEVVGSLPGEPFAPDLLQVLVDASLLGVKPGPDGRRYRLLEAVRAHAIARDDGAGRAAFVQGLRRRADAARVALGTPDEAPAMVWLAGHLDALRSAVDWARDPDAVADLVLASLPVISRQARPRLAKEGLDRVRAVGPAVDSARRFRMELARLAVLLDLGRGEDAREAAGRVLQDGRARGAREHVQAATRAGLVYRRLGDLDSAEDVLGEAVRQAEALGDKRLLAKARLELGVAQRQLRSTESALHTLQQARVEARLAGDPRTEAIAIGTLGLLHQRAGRRDQALGDLREARELSAALGDRQSVDILDNNIAGILVIRGETDEALATFDRLTHTLRERGATRSLAFAQTNRGILYNRLGDVRRGEACLREALACFESLSLSRGVAACHCQLARMRLASGDHRSALQHCASALEVAGSEASIVAQARVMQVMARAALEESVDEAPLDEEVPAEVEGLVACARRWLAEPGQRRAIQQELLAGE